MESQAATVRLLRGGRDVVFTKENSSCLLRAHDGTRRLVRMHRSYDAYRQESHSLTGCAAIPWPERSESVCWYCRRYFDNVPIKIPMCKNVDGSLTVMGNFSCFACMVAYMWRHRTLTTPEQMAMVVQLAEDCGIKGQRVPMAPPLEDLQESGGDMTWEEFDRLCATTVVRVTLRLPPMVETMIGIEETFEAISSGALGMEKVLEEVFGVKPEAVKRCKNLGELHEHSVASDRVEHMGIDVTNARRGKHTGSSRTPALQNADAGAMKRRMMAIMGEPTTVALDRLQPPSHEEIERRLQSQNSRQQSLNVSLYEEYVKQKEGGKRGGVLNLDDVSDATRAADDGTISALQQQQQQQQQQHVTGDRSRTSQGDVDAPDHASLSASNDSRKRARAAVEDVESTQASGGGHNRKSSRTDAREKGDDSDTRRHDRHSRIERCGEGNDPRRGSKSRERERRSRADRERTRDRTDRKHDARTERHKDRRTDEKRDVNRAKGGNATADRNADPNRRRDSEEKRSSECRRDSDRARDREDDTRRDRGGSSSSVAAAADAADADAAGCDSRSTRQRDDDDNGGRVCGGDDKRGGGNRERGGHSRNQHRDCESVTADNGRRQSRAAGQEPRKRSSGHSHERRELSEVHVHDECVTK